MKYARKYFAHFKIRILPQENIAKNFLAIEFCVSIYSHKNRVKITAHKSAAILVQIHRHYNMKII